MTTLRFLSSLPAFEQHGSKGCTLFVFAGSRWHSWDLPCTGDYGHRLALEEDVKTEIDRWSNNSPDDNGEVN